MGRVAAMDRDERNHWQSFFRHSATVGVLISSQHISYERNWAAGKSSIFGTLAFLITKLVSLLSGRTVVWLVYNWGLFHLWVMGMSSNWLKQKKKKRERERERLYGLIYREIYGNTGKFRDGLAWPQRLNSHPQECVAAIFRVASFPFSQASSFYKVQRWPPATSDLRLTA